MMLFSDWLVFELCFSIGNGCENEGFLSVFCSSGYFAVFGYDLPQKRVVSGICTQFSDPRKNIYNRIFKSWKTQAPESVCANIHLCFYEIISFILFDGPLEEVSYDLFLLIAGFKDKGKLIGTILLPFERYFRSSVRLT